MIPNITISDNANKEDIEDIEERRKNIRESWSKRFKSG
jgi:hypothetical protein